MIEKEIQLNVKFKYLSSEDMKEIERQIEKFNSDNEWRVDDITEFANDFDNDSKLLSPEIKNGNIIINIHRPWESEEDEVYKNLITFPIKDEENKYNIANEIYSYILYYIFPSSQLAYYLKFTGKFLIKNIDRYW